MYSKMEIVLIFLWDGGKWTEIQVTLGLDSRFFSLKTVALAKLILNPSFFICKMEVIRTLSNYENEKKMFGILKNSTNKII